MLLSKPLRRWLSSWLVLAMLFTQLASAAYVCPMATSVVRQVGGSTSTGAMPCETTMPGAGAAMLDTEQPGLCMQHCQDGSQTVDNAHLSSIPSPMLLPTLARWVPEPARLDFPAWAAQQRLRERGPELPLCINFCSYRI